MIINLSFKHLQTGQGLSLQRIESLSPNSVGHDFLSTSCAKDITHDSIIFSYFINFGTRKNKYLINVEKVIAFHRDRFRFFKLNIHNNADK